MDHWLNPSQGGKQKQESRKKGEEVQGEKENRIIMLVWLFTRKHHSAHTNPNATI